MRTRALLALLLVTPAGLATRFYTGPAEAWVQHRSGGILYVVFWILVARAVRPRLEPVPLAAAVLAAACALELLQLWHPPVLEATRETFVGAVVLGTTFEWWDFPHYVAGALAGGWLAGALGPRAPEPTGRVGRGAAAGEERQG